MQLRFAYAITIMTLVCSSLLSCNRDTSTPKKTLPHNEKIIRFVTINSPNTYYLNGKNEYAGLEYELAKRFVAFLGKDYQAQFIVVDSFAKVLPTLTNGEADIAAADISITPDRKKIVDFSNPLIDIQQHLAYNQEVTKPPKQLADIQGQIISLPAGTSFVERLRRLSTHNPNLAWEEIQHTSSEQLIESLANQEISFTIADNHLLDVMRYYYPSVATSFAIGEPEQIAWAVPKHAKPQHLEKINLFFNQIKADGTLRNLIDRYHGNTKRLKPFDVKTFLARTQTLLPKYTRLFKNAQEITDIDWRLLAAVSYQESHWDTYSTSPTNVRGLMMLTEDTSDMMNVSDRLDPAQSIPAGAKFLLWLKERFPQRIPEPDLTFMTLAAYNIGVGHVEDARVLAQRLKLNPDSWADVKKALVLLNNPDYYLRAKHGYCSCGAPVIYTESIRSYYQILEKHFPSHHPEQEPFKIAAR